MKNKKSWVLILLPLMAALILSTGLFRVKADTIYTHILNLGGGESFKVECPGGKIALSKFKLPDGTLDQSILAGVCNILGSSVTPTPTSTSPTPTLAPTPTGIISGDRTIWHSPGSHDGLNSHEHGDAPPDWANNFSMTNFDHGVVFGGDEATQNENAMKHQAYKGYLLKVNNHDIYVRYHAASNPMDRMVPFHSYEVYVRDPSEGVSFWQGWYFVSYPDDPNGRRPRDNESGRNPFFIGYVTQSNWDNYLRCEQWYMTAGSWSWDMGLTICSATTLSSLDEYLPEKKDYYMNMDNWTLTGNMGLTRRMEVSWYGPTNPIAPNRGNPPIGKWFCVNKAPSSDTRRPIQSIVVRDAGGPTNCPQGTLSEFIADTMGKEGIYYKQGNSSQKTYPGQGIVSVPN